MVGNLIVSELVFQVHLQLAFNLIIVWKSPRSP
jgi:hypothetical protein